jgi:hypothetical protein
MISFDGEISSVSKDIPDAQVRKAKIAQKLEN